MHDPHLIFPSPHLSPPLPSPLLPFDAHHVEYGNLVHEGEDKMRKQNASVSEHKKEF